jgi:Na+/H+ antiporter NhaD/arsenite permease-like protein
MPIFCATVSAPPLWLLLPFGALLLFIAVMPLSPERVKTWWEHSYHYVVLGLAVLVGSWYLLQVDDGGHRLLHAGGEYLSFLALIGSLFVVAGGIHIKVRGAATPIENVVFLFVGALLANVIGTTGASMVLIRPFIRMNKIRVSAHHIVFFIFVVSNVGGALTPIGDPPLFLGYLRGVPFFWLTEHVLPAWLFTVGAVLAAFYVFDLRSFKHAPARIQHGIEQTRETWRFDGAVNVLFLAAIVGAVFCPDRFLLRELMMIAAAAGSYFLTPAEVHQENHFNFGPIKEVAWLFLGIFATMVPALDYLEVHGHEVALTRPGHYYFAAGALSAVLDNAPTYVNFLKLAQVRTAGAGLGEQAQLAALLHEAPLVLVAVSLGAVFFGAMTYIGNGPNFMVKSIAASAGVHTPGFFGYVLRYSVPVLLPILALTAWLFL